MDSPEHVHIEHGRFRRLMAYESRLQRPEPEGCLQTENKHEEHLLTQPTSLEMFTNCSQRRLQHATLDSPRWFVSRASRFRRPMARTPRARRQPCSQRVIRACLPSRAARSVRRHDVPIDAKTNQLFRRALLWTPLATVPPNGSSRVGWQHLEQRPGVADLLCGPLGILRVRTTGVLSHSFAPRACSLAEG